MAVSRRLRYEVLRREPETWRPVVGYEGLYEVSDLGHVRSVPRTVVDSRGVPRRFRGAELRNVHRGLPGYVSISLYRDGKRRCAWLHILVAEAFLGPRPPGMEVAHGNGNPSTNRLSNLRYATPAENQADKRQHGTDNAGERHPCARLTRAAVVEVRRHLASGERQADVAASYGVARTTVSAIATGRSWGAA